MITTILQSSPRIVELFLLVSFKPPITLNMDTASPTMLDHFQNYKQFYLSQINSNKNKDTKIPLMCKVIDNLMEQHEILLQILLEVQQTTMNRSMQLHCLMQKTAHKSCEVGQALSSFELEVKQFSEEALPSFIECAACFEQINSHVDTLVEENAALRRENRQFFKDIQSQTAELVQYKNMVYHLMAGKGLSSKLPQKNQIDIQNTSYLELTLNNTLTELNEAASMAVCANVLEEVITGVEVELENENNVCNQTADLQTNGQPIDLIMKKYGKGKMYDINDNYEFDDSTVTDCSFVESLGNDSSPYVEYDLKSFRPKTLSLLSILCNELASKTPALYDIQRQLSHIKMIHLSLHNRHFQMAIHILSTIVHLKDEIGSKLDSGQIRQKLLEKLDAEIQHVLDVFESPNLASAKV